MRRICDPLPAVSFADAAQRMQSRCAAPLSVYAAPFVLGLCLYDVARPHLNDSDSIPFSS
jgi:hypothetical protein